MNEMQSLESKIQDLQKKKEALHAKSFAQMQKTMKDILKEDYDPELCMAIIADTWKHASPALRQELKQKAESFSLQKNMKKNLLLQKNKTQPCN